MYWTGKGICTIVIGIMLCCVEVGQCTEEESLEELPSYAAEDDEMDCPSGKEKWMPVKWVPWGVPGRARLTLPPGVTLAPSFIPGAGLGVIATTFIAKYTWLSEYEGEIVLSEYKCSHYAWVVWRDGETDYLVDGGDESTSSWLRWINTSRHVKEENVKFLECLGKVYYMTTRDVHPGEELLVYYGEEYGKSLDIDTDNYRNMAVDIELYKPYACWNIRT